MAPAAFEERLKDTAFPVLRSIAVDTLQVNLGKLCNQVCKHCHVDAGPARTEVMTAETAELVVDTLARHPEIQTLDLTGGAPELCPSFRRLVSATRALERRVIDRCNLTVLNQPGQEDLGQFLCDQGVEIVASLPYYLQEQVDRQRGRGVHDQSIEALLRLNSLGYGRPDSGLVLHLVYNPLGAFLPPPQHEIEADYRRELGRRWGIVFNRLYTFTNMPISRFKAFLDVSGNYERYMERLAQSFNPRTLPDLMCRRMVSVGWDGRLYDCDFNQMLNLPLDRSAPQHLRDFDTFLLSARTIVTGSHCYGCTAGAGSSCGGTLVR